MNNYIKSLFAENFDPRGVASKNLFFKKQIFLWLDTHGAATIPELSRGLNISVPKVTSLVNELMKDGLIINNGKVESTGGRRAAVYGLAKKICYFIGVDVKRYYINIGLFDLNKNLVKLKEKIPYPLENTQQALSALIQNIKKFIRESGVGSSRILGMGINLSGRVNHFTGYSYSYFHFQEEPLASIIAHETGIKTFLENDSNAMAYGEFAQGAVKDEKHVIFLNLDYGTGTGIIINKKLYYGKSGFSGEFGHIPFFDNNILCGCGKKGCLETEISGMALIRRVKEKIQGGSPSLLTKKVKNLQNLKLEDVVEAALTDDMLVIELLSEMGEKLGKALSVLINLFNPELVILGGKLSETGDYLRLPARSAMNKYSLSLVNNDTQLKLSELGERAGVIGAGLIARNRVISNEY
ncbi:MAG: ROK family transcriptional regulator [Chitinophagaceae bacterium]|nr:ROK family transcriptional regulator [Chitinophagaceae bacterium]